MTDKIREQIAWMRCTYMNFPRNCKELEAADTMERLLAVYEAAARIYNRHTHSQSDAERLTDAIAAVEKGDGEIRHGLGTYDDGMVKLGYRSGSSDDGSRSL